jgi:ankyrin repeat protein
MDTSVDLIKAIRSGLVAEVIAALDAGASVELNNGQGDPGLPLAIACFLGHAEIVRELALRGAKINFDDNREPTSPLSVAIRAGKTEVVKVLIEVGANLPPGMQTALNEHELMLARWKAQHFGAHCAAGNDADDYEEPLIEEIDVLGCYGTDTNILDADMRRMVEGKPSKK